MDLIAFFQDLVAQVPEILRPLIVALAGAVPFVEGEGAAAIGIVVGGLNPVVAGLAAATGNFACVAVLVLASSNVRSAVISRRRARSERREAVHAGGGLPSGAAAQETAEPAELDPAADGTDVPAESSRAAARRVKFQRALDRYGVPGVSLLGPLLLPTQFTATMLAAGGVSKARVLLWQAVAIVAWTTAVAAVVGGVVSVAH